MCPSPRRRVRADLISFFVLIISVGLMNALLQVPPQLLLFTEAGEEEEEEHEATFGADALRYQLMKLQDAYGRIPANAYARAKSQVNLLKWSGAARRVEQAPPVPVAPTMFSATAPASAAGASLITPKSWRWLGPGNVGGRIRSIVVHPAKPGTLFAGSVGGGIWKTTNGGSSWAPVDDFMPVLSVSSLVFNPSNPNLMFAGTGEGYGNADSLRGAGIFKSADGGTTWTQLAQTATQFSAVTRLAISPSGAVILAGTNTGLWRSTNGATFTWINSGLTPQDVDFNPLNGRRAIAAGYGAVAYSWDGGLTWQRSGGVPTGAGRIELAFARSQPDTIYALVDHDGGTLYRSSDGGASFRAVSADPLLDNNQGWYRRGACGSTRATATTLSSAAFTCGRPSTAARPGSGSATASTSITTSSSRIRATTMRGTARCSSATTAVSTRPLTSATPPGRDTRRSTTTSASRSSTARPGTRTPARSSAARRTTARSSTSRCRRRDGSSRCPATAGSSRRMRPMRRISTPA